MMTTTMKREEGEEEGRRERGALLIQNEDPTPQDGWEKIRAAGFWQFSAPGGPSAGPGAVRKRLRMKNRSRGKGRDFRGPRTEKWGVGRGEWNGMDLSRSESHITLTFSEPAAKRKDSTTNSGYASAERNRSQGMTIRSDG